VRENRIGIQKNEENQR